MEELATLQPGSALEIPLSDVGGVGLANLRSAVHRAATSAGLNLETLADDGKFGEALFQIANRPIDPTGNTLGHPLRRP